MNMMFSCLSKILISLHLGEGTPIHSSIPVIFFPPQLTDICFQYYMHYFKIETSFFLLTLVLLQYSETQGSEIKQKGK